MRWERQGVYKSRYESEEEWDCHLREGMLDESEACEVFFREVEEDEIEELRWEFVHFSLAGVNLECVFQRRSTGAFCQPK